MSTRLRAFLTAITVVALLAAGVSVAGIFLEPVSSASAVSAVKHKAKLVTVPNMIGDSSNVAAAQLGSLKLDYTFNQSVVNKAHWVVNSTIPAAGTRVAKGSTVKLIVSLIYVAPVVDDATTDGLTSANAWAACQLYGTTMYPSGFTLNSATGVLTMTLDTTNDEWVLKATSSVTSSEGVVTPSVTSCTVSGSNDIATVSSFSTT